MTAQARCQNCGFTQVAGLARDAALAAGDPCPSCGLTLEVRAKSRTEHGLDSLKDYLQTLKEIHFSPDEFFKKMPEVGGLGRPLAFALITHWVAAAVGFLWVSAFGSSLMHPLVWLSRFGKLSQMSDTIDYPGRGAQLADLQSRLVSWFWGAGSIIADPFMTLATILFTSFLVYLGARILVPNRRVTYESAARIISYGMAPSILGSVPILGAAVSGLWILVATVAGARQTYQIGSTRAIIIVLFPKLIFLAIFFAIFLTIVMIFFQMAFQFL